MKVPWKTVLRFLIAVFSITVLVINLAYAMINADRFSAIRENKAFVATNWQVFLLGVLILSLAMLIYVNLDKLFPE